VFSLPERLDSNHENPLILKIRVMAQNGEGGAMLVNRKSFTAKEL